MAMVNIYDKSIDSNECQGKETSVPIPYLEWDNKGNILCANNALIAKCGFDFNRNFKEYFKNINDFFSGPTTRESVHKAFAKVANNGKKCLEKYPVCIRAERSIIHTYADIQVDEDGNYRANIDINSSDFYQEIVEKSSSGTFVSTEDGKFSIVNQKLLDIYGYESTDEMLAVDIASKIYSSSADRQRLLQLLTDLKPDEKIENFQFIAQRKNGKIILISKDVHAKFFDGDLIYLFGYVKDISQHVGELDSPTPSFACDLKGNIFYVNKVMASWLGYSRQELETSNIAQLDLDSDRHERLLWLKQLKEQRGLHDSPINLTKKDGDKIKVFINVIVVTSKNGNSKDDVYIKGWLSDKPGGPVSIIWIEKLKQLLRSDKYNLSSEIQELTVSAVSEISQQLSITHLDDPEIRQIVQSIQRIQNETDDGIVKNDDLESFFLRQLTARKYSLKEKVSLDVWHSLQFFSRRNELLKDALTISQVSRMFGISEENILDKIKDKLFLAIDLNGEFLFPVWQFNIKSGIGEKLPKILTALEISDLAKLSWLMNPNPVLEGKKPFEILSSQTASEDDKQRVLNEAYGVGGC